MTDSNQPDGFYTKPGEDGNVEFGFIDGGKQVLTGKLTPEEVSGLVTGLLNGANISFQDSGKTLDPEITQVPLTGAVEGSMQWFMGRSNVQGKHIVAVQVGPTVIGFTVSADKMRGLGRVLIASSWKVGRNTGGAVSLGSLLKESCADIYAWMFLTAVRWKDALQRRRAFLVPWILGRSFRPFRTVTFSPDRGFVDYEPVKKCIYCGATVYSERPGIRRSPLGREHIVAEGLGGTLELPEASCQKCEETTGAVVEGNVTGRTLRAFRIHLQIRGKRRKLPATLPLTRNQPLPEEEVEIPIADYPIVFNMPMYGIPGLFVGGPGGNQTTEGFRFVPVSYNQSKLRKTYGITSFSTAWWDTHMLFRMLAKIGHAFATAEIPEKFSPDLVDMIRNGTPDKFNHIGGDPYRSEWPSTALHELSLGYQRAKGKDYVVARIRLFARHSGPVYYVVVGESLESRIAKFKRRASRRSSSILAL